MRPNEYRYTKEAASSNTAKQKSTTVTKSFHWGEEKRKSQKQRNEAPKSADTPFPDSGNSQHIYIQTLIKKIGERSGFVSIIEQQVFGGAGKIDVALERDGLKIGCEVAVTNSVEYEVLNIQKCFASGFELVAVVSENEGHLNRIKKHALDSVSEFQKERLHFLSPETFHLFLKNAAKTDHGSPSDERVKGYKVTTEMELKDEIGRAKTINEILEQAIKRNAK